MATMLAMIHGLGHLGANVGVRVDVEFIRIGGHSANLWRSAIDAARAADDGQVEEVLAGALRRL